MNVSFDQMTAVHDGKLLKFAKGMRGYCCRRCALSALGPCDMPGTRVCEPHKRKDSGNGYWKEAKRE